VNRRVLRPGIVRDADPGLREHDRRLRAWQLHGLAWLD
jgi:hypothetical protein